MPNSNAINEPDTFEKKVILTLKLPNVRFFIGVTIAIIAGFTGHYFGLDNKESIALSSVFIVATTLWYNALNLYLNYQVNERKIALDKQVIATNMITEWYKDFSQKSAIARKFIKTHYKAGDQNNWELAATVVTAVDTDEDIKEAVLAILNYFEKIALAVNMNVADGVIIEKYFKEIFSTYYQCFYPLIRSRQKGPIAALPEVFKYFCELTVSYGVPDQRT